MVPRFLRFFMFLFWYVLPSPKRNIIIPSQHYRHRNALDGELRGGNGQHGSLDNLLL